MRCRQWASLYQLSLPHPQAGGHHRARRDQRHQRLLVHDRNLAVRLAREGPHDCRVRPEPRARVQHACQPHRAGHRVEVLHVHRDAHRRARHHPLTSPKSRASRSTRSRSPLFRAGAWTARTLRGASTPRATRTNRATAHFGNTPSRATTREPRTRFSRKS